MSPQRESEPPNCARRIVLTSRWQLDTSAARLWPLLADAPQWPSWWPGLRGAAADGSDEVALRLRGGLPLDIRLRLALTASEPARWLEYRARGDVYGVAAWIIEPGGGGVDVTCRWELAAERRWLRALHALSRSALAWNHFWMMRNAARGLAHALGASTSPVSEWTGYRRR